MYIYSIYRQRYVVCIYILYIYVGVPALFFQIIELSEKVFLTYIRFITIRSDQISHSIVSDSLRPHESQHARPLYHPEFTQTHVHRVGDTIQPSHSLSSPSPPAPNPSQHQSLFQ